MIRKAMVTDVDDIQRLVNFYANRGLMLPRSQGDICENIRDFFVYEIDGEIVGCCALNVTWLDLAEIRSLAVKEGFEGRGIGTELIESCMKDASELGIRKIFVLTYQPEFFEKLGFKKIDKSELPHKVWVECIKCVKFPDCNEVALIRTYDNEPPVEPGAG